MDTYDMICNWASWCDHVSCYGVCATGWKREWIINLGGSVAIHQVLEQIIILQSNQYSVSVHTYCVDGQLPSIKEIPQVTGDLHSL